MQGRDLLFLYFGEQLRVKSGVVILKFDGRKSIHLKQGFIAEALFILRDGKAIPYISIMNDIVIRIKYNVRKDSFTKMDCACEKILCNIL